MVAPRVRPTRPEGLARARRTYSTPRTIENIGDIGAPRIISAANTATTTTTTTTTIITATTVLQRLPPLQELERKMYKSNAR